MPFILIDKHLPCKNEYVCLHKTYNKVYSNFIHNCQNWKCLTHPSVNGQKCVVLPHSELQQRTTIKENELLIHVTTWVNIKCILLCKRSQTKRPTWCMSSFYRLHILHDSIHMTWKKQNIGMENKLVVCRDW